MFVLWNICETGFFDAYVIAATVWTLVPLPASVEISKKKNA